MVSIVTAAATHMNTYNRWERDLANDRSFPNPGMPPGPGLKVLEAADTKLR